MMGTPGLAEGCCLCCSPKYLLEAEEEGEETP